MVGVSPIRRDPKQPATLLCIDDRVIYLPIRKAYLESHGYAVLTAASGREGLQLLAEHMIAAVVLDYRMPEMNGGEVARVIRRTRPGLPIIMLSGFAGEIPSDVRSLVNVVVAKGEGTKALLEALETALPNAVLSPRVQAPTRGSIKQTRQQVQRTREAVAERRRRFSGGRR